MKIGIQGLEGSFHHQAAKQFFGDNMKIAPFDNFQQVFDALDSGAVDRAVVAIENSLYGSINDSYDFLLQYTPQIIGEVYLHVRLDLLSIPGAELDDITDVYSQAPALAESKVFLREHLPSATQHEYPDTAMSARFVAKQNKSNMACVASQMAGELYELEPIEESIEDHKHNYTRFVILSKQTTTIIDANKTSIVLQTSHKPGSLYAALGAFANNGINLSKIESRPTIDEINDSNWHYFFYLDFEAGLNDSRTKKAMSDLEKSNLDAVILGSYIRGKLPI